jgi:hypothetical protein
VRGLHALPAVFDDAPLFSVSILSVIFLIAFFRLGFALVFLITGNLTDGMFEVNKSTMASALFSILATGLVIYLLFSEFL